jgi:DHA2 family multidrug resistance protein-like MFS transporter
MGATREAQLGVGSAIHDVTRQLAGALGVAVVGSAHAALYARRIDAATAALPEA